MKRFLALLLIVMLIVSSFEIIVLSDETNENVRTGNYSFKIVTETKSDAYGWRDRNINVKANTDYVVSFWSKGFGNKLIRINKADWSATITDTQFSGGNNWTKKTFEFNSGDNTSIKVAFANNPGGGVGTVYVDDIVVYEKADASAIVLNEGFESGKIWGGEDASFMIEKNISEPVEDDPIDPPVAGNTEAYSKTYYRGVNLSGPESGASVIPGNEGTHYTFGEEKIYEYLERKGFDIARIPVLWERLQPTLSGELDSSYLDGIRRNAKWAEKHNMKIIIDIHNYGMYNNTLIGVSDKVKNSDFADLWSRLSKEFKGNKGVYAYDIMNEPVYTGAYDVGYWHKASQAAVDAIRQNNDDTLIFVEGNFYAHCSNWVGINGEKPWISDPYDNTTYSAHCYFDSDQSGKYVLSYDEQLAKTPNLNQVGANRLKDFGEWCKKYNLKGYVGEFGAPYRDDSKTGEFQDSTRWTGVIDEFLNTVDSYGMDATIWAAGAWWGTVNILNVYPQDSNSKYLSKDSVHMAALTKHLSNKEDYSQLSFGEIRSYEAEYAITSGSSVRTADDSASNGVYVTLPDDKSGLEYGRIKAPYSGNTRLTVTYSNKASDSADLYAEINGIKTKCMTLEPTGGANKFNEYKTSVDILDGDNILIFSTDSDDSIAIDKIDITLVQTSLSSFESPVDGDSIRLYYSSQSNTVATVRVGDTAKQFELPSTMGKAVPILFEFGINKGDLVEITAEGLISVSVIDSEYSKKDSSSTMLLPKSIDEYATAVTQRKVANFNNDSDEIWGYKGDNGNMLNWDISKVFRDDSATDRYYRVSFTETGKKGSMHTPRMHLPFGENHMYSLSGFKYVTLDIRSNTDVTVSLYHNIEPARETDGRYTVKNTNGLWTTVSIPIEAFNSKWLYNDFERIPSVGRANYMLFRPAFVDGGSDYRYFDIDNISFNWADSKIGITDLNYFNREGTNINTLGPEGGSTTIKVNVRANRDIDSDVTSYKTILIFAVYDKFSGVLRSIDTDEKTVSVNTQTLFEATVDVPETDSGRYETRAFLWDSLTLCPITEVSKF